jgi:hypothetical protein
MQTSVLSSLRISTFRDEIHVVYDVNIFGGSVHTVKENAEALVDATKEIGVEVNTDKTKTWLCLGIGMQGGVTA